MNLEKYHSILVNKFKIIVNFTAKSFKRHKNTSQRKFIAQFYFDTKIRISWAFKDEKYFSHNNNLKFYT